MKKSNHLKSLLLISCILFFCITLIYGQGNSGITVNGDYVFGKAYSQPGQNLNLFVVRSTSNKWHRQLLNANKLKFGEDNRTLFYLQNNNLCLLTLGTNFIDTISSVRDYSLEAKYLLYRKTDDTSLVMRNLLTKNEVKHKAVSEYFFNIRGNFLILMTHNQGFNRESILTKFDLDRNQQKLIWSGKGEKIIRKAFSQDGKKFAFLSNSGNHKNLWYYDVNEGNAKLVLSDSNLNLKSKYILNSSVLDFVPNGHRLILYLNSKDELPNSVWRKDMENLNSYLDAKPNFYWKTDLSYQKKQLISIDLKSSRITFIERDKDLIIGSNMPFKGYQKMQINNNVALIYSFEKEVLSYMNSRRETSDYSMSQFNINKYIQPDIYAVNLNDGTRKLIKRKVKIISSDFPTFSLSPNGNKVVYYDTDEQHYFAIDLESNKRINISSSIKTGFNLKDSFSNSYSAYQTSYFSLSGGIHTILWHENELVVLVQDHYSDIWMLYLNGKDAVCLTEGFGKKNLVSIQIDRSFEGNIFKENDFLKLKIYSSDFSKTNGIGLLEISKRRLITIAEIGTGFRVDLKQTKGSLISIWEIQNDSNPPTLYWGKNFEDGKPICEDLIKRNPVKQEILVWSDSTGAKHHGIIFFPKNFDNTQKYPVLINYYASKKMLVAKYEDYTDFKNETELGYVLFIPDLKFKVGYTSETVANIVISGALELMKKSFIDNEKIGIFGGSFGGYHTNCIIGQTNIFAAAFSVSGISDLISAIGSEDKDGQQASNSLKVINGQQNIGVSLWDRPDLYLSNSPVFFADRITCPVLLLHGTQDRRVPFTQGMEFYKALQANGKRAWLDAPDMEHAGGERGSVVGYIKARQFFAHYLKDEPAPYWMTRPALEILEKGLDPYAYDLEIKTPGEGIIPKEKTYAPDVLELLKHRTTIDKNGRIVDVKNN